MKNKKKCCNPFKLRLAQTALGLGFFVVISCALALGYGLITAFFNLNHSLTKDEVMFVRVMTLIFSSILAASFGADYLEKYDRG